MKLTGKKLQYAYLLVAEGKMSDSEIAKYLKIPLRSLAVCKERPYFAKRVREFQSLLNLIKARRGVNPSSEEGTSSIGTWKKLGDGAASGEILDVRDSDQTGNAEVAAGNELLRSPLFKSSLPAR